jgi:hypothetical protein
MDLGNPMMVHLAKFLLFSNSAHEEHWKKEIITFIITGSSVKSKGGKFNYSWFFEDAKPFTIRRLQEFLDRAQDSEENLTSIEVSTADFKALLILFEKELNKEFKAVGSTLLKQEIKEILTSCLEGVRK